MARRFGRWHRVRALVYRLRGVIPDPKPWPDYGTPKGKNYSEEVLSDAPLAYWRLGESALDDGVRTYPSALGPDAIAMSHRDGDEED
jgi:hypothetical protein